MHTSRHTHIHRVTAWDPQLPAAPAAQQAAGSAPRVPGPCPAQAAALPPQVLPHHQEPLTHPAPALRPAPQRRPSWAQPPPAPPALRTTQVLRRPQHPAVGAPAAACPTTSSVACPTPMAAGARRHGAPRAHSAPQEAQRGPRAPRWPEDPPPPPAPAAPPAAAGTAGTRRRGARPAWRGTRGRWRARSRTPPSRRWPRSCPGTPRTRAARPPARSAGRAPAARAPARAAPAPAAPRGLQHRQSHSLCHASLTSLVAATAPRWRSGWRPGTPHTRMAYTVTLAGGARCMPCDPAPGTSHPPSFIVC